MRNQLVGVRAAAMLASALGVFLLSSIAFVLSTPAMAGETAPGSTEALKLSSSGERAVGKPTSITAEGNADGSHRLFVYYEPNDACRGRPFVEQERAGVVTLSSAAGDELGAGAFKRSFTGPAPAVSDSKYAVCGYLDTAASQYPDAFTFECFWIPEGPCYAGGISPWSEFLSELQSKQVREEYEARKRQEEREKSEREAREAALQQQPAQPSQQTPLQKTLRCKVPNLLGHTLNAVRRLLTRTHCKLGRITTRRGGNGPLVVTAQNPARGKTIRAGAPIAVTLSRRDR